MIQLRSEHPKCLEYALIALVPLPSQDRKQPDVCDHFFHDVPFEANFASDIPELQSMTAMPGVDGFTMKVDALYKVCGSLWVEHSRLKSFVPFYGFFMMTSVYFVKWLFLLIEENTDERGLRLHHHCTSELNQCWDEDC